MFDQILVPVDGSPTSLRAIDKAIALAKAFQSKVSVISIVDPYPLMGMNAEIPYGQEDFHKAAKAEAKAQDKSDKMKAKADAKAEKKAEKKAEVKADAKNVALQTAPAATVQK